MARERERVWEIREDGGCGMWEVDGDDRFGELGFGVWSFIVI